MASSRELKGRLAVVTGGWSGIGRAAAERLVRAGAHVVLVARSADRLRAAASELHAEVCVANIATEEGLAQVARTATAHGGLPDIIVHAAGAFSLAAVAETSVAEFDRMIAVNLRAAFLVARTFLPAMLERGSGDLVFVGSVAGRQAFPANGAYSASKFGLRGLHAVLAAELRGTGVRATLIEPAATDTSLWDDIDRGRNPGLPERSAMLPPAAVADAVLYAVTRPTGVGTPNILVERV